MKSMIAASVIGLSISTFSPPAPAGTISGVKGLSVNTDISSARRHRGKRHHHYRRGDPVRVIAARQEATISAQRIAVVRLRTEMYNIKRELDSFRERIGPPVPLAVVFAPQQALLAYGSQLPFPDVREQVAPPEEPVNPTTASLPVATEVPLNTPHHPRPNQAYRVFPCTCTQRGQWGDKRPTHTHAGIDMGGEYGSPIIASIGGVVLSPPGGDRGYGPHAMVIRGRDGNVYRYAHMRRVLAHPGDKVSTGQKIGEMGHVGTHGFTHLHFEIIDGKEYHSHPYGFHRSLNPNALLGGHRGAHMAGGEPMRGGGVQTAELSLSDADSSRAPRHHRKHKRIRSARR